jgi:transketolase
VICGDGCLEEGISHEAASLAGHLELGRLIYVYDDNHITIDGPTELAYNDNVPKRFAAYGWDVDAIGEVANDVDALEAALRRAMANEVQPSLIVLRSHIGWPAPEIMDTKEAHGTPLSAEEIRKTKEILGLPPDESFWIPDAVAELYRRCLARGEELHRAWQARFDSADIDQAVWAASLSGRGLEGWDSRLPSFEAGTDLATRRAINACINATAPVIPGLLVGAADLTENTGVTLDGAEPQSKEHPGGRQLHYGIREHGMAAAMTGMALHGGILPVGGTFFTFSDYMRPAVRLAAMSQAHVIYSWTHDSIGVGEDGPTHEPVEQLPSLRAMPGLTVVRPADANECAQAWRLAVEADGPVGMVLSRQSIPVLAETAVLAGEGVGRGGYVLRREDRAADLVLIGTGSEVHLCLGAAELLTAEGVSVRVVSLPCWEWFEDQDWEYRRSVLPHGVPTLSVEAAAPLGWERYADASVAVHTFGASGPSAAVMAHFGFTVENVTEAARELLERSRP